MTTNNTHWAVVIRVPCMAKHLDSSPSFLCLVADHWFGNYHSDPQQLVIWVIAWQFPVIAKNCPVISCLVLECYWRTKQEITNICTANIGGTLCELRFTHYLMEWMIPHSMMQKTFTWTFFTVHCCHFHSWCDFFVFASSHLCNVTANNSFHFLDHGSMQNTFPLKFYIKCQFEQSNLTQCLAIVKNLSLLAMSLFFNQTLVTMEGGITWILFFLSSILAFSYF